jgi:IS5 family transposase
MLTEENRLNRLSKLGDNLEKITAAVDFEIFRPLLKKAIERKNGAKGGRPPFDLVMMFKIILLEQWNNLSDDRMEYYINDRLSYQRFLGLSLSSKVPDANTIWVFKEDIKESRVHDELFNLFDRILTGKGIIKHETTLIDASFVDVPRQRVPKEAYKKIKENKMPTKEEAQAEPEGNPHEQAQRDTDARWAKKNDEVHFGYKNHIAADGKTKLITGYRVSAANLHDSQMFMALLIVYYFELYADSGYTGKAIQDEILRIYTKMHLHICAKGTWNHELTDEEKASNHAISKIRCRIEHVFGHMTNAMGEMTIRTIGYSRAEREICIKNLAYNIDRFATLTRMGQAQKICAA